MNAPIDNENDPALRPYLDATAGKRAAQNEGLTGQQIQQLRATAAADLRTMVERIGLRQKCLELAVQVCVGQPDQVINLARAMHEFAAFPATELAGKIEPSLS